MANDWTNTKKKVNGVKINQFNPSKTYTKQQQEVDKIYAQADAMMQKIQNRPAFAYDFNNDIGYQTYKDQYMDSARRMNEDVQAQAAALSGGYGNSYGASAGAQAYQGQLNRLNSIIPTLEQNARGRYDQETNDMYNRLNALNTSAANKQKIAENTYSKEYQDWANAIAQSTKTSGGSSGGGKNPEENDLNMMKEMRNYLNTLNGYQAQMNAISDVYKAGKITQAEMNKLRYEYSGRGGRNANK